MKPWEFWENIWKLRWHIYKINHILAADSSKVANMVPAYRYDTAFFSMVKYANCLIYIFMNININTRLKRKNRQKIKGYTYKITNISAAHCPRVANSIL